MRVKAGRIVKGEARNWGRKEEGKKQILEASKNKKRKKTGKNKIRAEGGSLG